MPKQVERCVILGTTRAPKCTPVQVEDFPFQILGLGFCKRLDQKKQLADSSKALGGLLGNSADTVRVTDPCVFALFLGFPGYSLLFGSEGDLLSVGQR